MTLKRYFLGVSAVYVGLVMAFGVTSCMSLARTQEVAEQSKEGGIMLEILVEEIEGLKNDLAEISATDPNAAEAADKIALMITSATEEAAKWTTIIVEANEKLSKAKTGWDWAASLTGLASGFFPPLAVAVPMIRRGQRMFNGVVDAVAAGGGVVDKDGLTSKTMAMIPGLKERVTARRVEIDDKVLKAVKA